MKRLKIGVIDIGSDSIKMIIANTDKGLSIEKKLKEYSKYINRKIRD